MLKQNSQKKIGLDAGQPERDKQSNKAANVIILFTAGILIPALHVCLFYMGFLSK